METLGQLRASCGRVGSAYLDAPFSLKIAVDCVAEAFVAQDADCLSFGETLASSGGRD